ncbi:MAG: hypothetical protein OXI87_23560 [Albidovulum sp.]|nr:hypothetical protein [Albidovulum sp.]
MTLNRHYEGIRIFAEAILDCFDETLPDSGKFPTDAITGNFRLTSRDGHQAAE